MTRGIIVGNYRDSQNDLHGFILMNGDFTSFDLPDVLETSINGINNSGQLSIRFTDDEGIRHGAIGQLGILCAGLTPTMGCTVNGVSDQLCIGTPNKDTIVGTPGNDVIVGLEGNDTLSGLGGDDAICGGDANAINGGNGKDILSGMDGRDTISGGRGADQIFGGTGNDILGGNDGNDRLVGSGGNDTLNGGANTDTCDGGSGSDAAVMCESITDIP